MCVLWRMDRRAVERHTRWSALSLTIPQLRWRILNRASFLKLPMNYSSRLPSLLNHSTDCLTAISHLDCHVSGWSQRSLQTVIRWRCQWWRSIIMRFWTCWQEMKMVKRSGWRERLSPPAQAPVMFPVWHMSEWQQSGYRWHHVLQVQFLNCLISWPVVM